MAEENHTNLLCPMFLPDPRSHITVRLRGVNTEEAARIYVKECFRRVESELSVDNWDTVVFSAEGLSNLSAASLSDMRNWLGRFVDEVRAIYWLRQPISFSVSVLQELLKGGLTIEGALDQYQSLTNYRRRIENAIAAFGLGNLSVQKFEDAIAHPGGAVAAFCEQIGLPTEIIDEITADVTVENESMSMLAGYAVNALNRMSPLLVDGKIGANRSPGDFVKFLEIKGPRFDLSEENRQRVNDAAISEIEWLTQQFGREFYPEILSGSAVSAVKSQIPDRETAESVAVYIQRLTQRQ